MGSLVIALAGHARSGKTSIAEALSHRIGLAVTRFSAEVAREADARGLALDPPEVRRASLMTLGAELVATDVRGLAERVLRAGDWAPGGSVIVEGVRHASAANALRELVAPTPLLLVLVATPPAIREARLRTEGLGGRAAVASMDAHSTEREVAEHLPSLADLTVSGAEDVDEAVEHIVLGMRAWGWDR